MTKQGTALVLVVVAVSVTYDFFRGYYHSRSISEGIAHVIFGLALTAFFLRLYFKGPRPT